MAAALLGSRQQVRIIDLDSHLSPVSRDLNAFSASRLFGKVELTEFLTTLGNKLRMSQ